MRKANALIDTAKNAMDAIGGSGAGLGIGALMGIPMKKGGTTGKKKPSSGLTEKQKSSVAKKASAGKDIGKKGKSFADVAAKAGGGEKGKKIAAAAMWKNIKRKG